MPPLEALFTFQPDENDDDFFQRLMPGPSGFPPLTFRDVVQTVRFWRQFPILWNAAEQRPDPKKAQEAILAFHLHAEAILAVAAERCGLDSASLAKSGDLCRAVTVAHPEIEEDGEPWPGSILENPTLPEEDRATVTAAEHVLRRLLAKMASGPAPIDAQTDRAEIAGRPAAGVLARNRWFVDEYNALGTETYRRPSAIAHKWNGMKAEERAAICPDSPGKLATASVASAIKRTLKSRQIRH